MQYCHYIEQMSHFLEYKPSRKAAASLIAAININLSDVAPKIGLKKLHDFQIDSLVVDPSICSEFSAKISKDPSANSPLHIWSDSVECLTYLKKKNDIEPVYKILMETLNVTFYEEKLYGDPALFVATDDMELQSQGETCSEDDKKD